MNNKRFLEIYNKVDCDIEIKFKEEGHKYYVYSKLLNKWCSSDEGCGSKPIISTTTILNRYFIPVDFETLARRIFVKVENRIAMENNVNYKYYGCKSIDDILKIWGKGALLGTKMHNTFEDIANLIEYYRHNDENFEKLKKSKIFKECEEINYFIDFCKQFKILSGEIIFWRTEFLLANDILNISGMIDGILYDKKNDSYIIIDYKRIKGGLKIDPQNPRKSINQLGEKSKGRILPSFKLLRNNSGNKYGCQLTIYKNLFEFMFPEKKISGLFLIVVDSSKLGQKSGLKIHEVPLKKYQTCVNETFAHRSYEILSDCGDDLPNDLVKKLIKYRDI